MQYTNVIIGGDLNLDRSKPRIKEGKLLVDLEEVYGLSCLIKEPTRITANSQTLISFHFFILFLNIYTGKRKQNQPRKNKLAKREYALVRGRKF